MPINEAEKKLLEYRLKKEREERRELLKVKLKSMLTSPWRKKHEKTEDNELDTSLLPSPASSIPESEEVEDNLSDCEASPQPLTVFDYIQYVLWFILWVTVYAIFIKLEFGVIYLIVSGLVGMYLNTRTGPKKKNEISAYSVFNKNCEKIGGTLDGEKMTQQMLYGGFVR
ncbi:uncharacterized protein LOC126735277 [Anthonomus grandis grandis]|uniref:uncharacterized protein LOC126735277 n=1 Tax=Anthonomus grandis grandis TaxID=2921223 RepID=UPI0021660BD1|nr:uncharacterized protein LOC126735277 [Anthonomus grandis grandis]